MIPTERHLKAARILAGMTQEDLAKASGLGKTTVQHMEGLGGMIGARPATKGKIEEALKKVGVVVTDSAIYLTEEWCRLV